VATTQPNTVPTGAFEPAAISAFRFVDRDFDQASGELRLRYALDDVATFEESIAVPVAGATAADVPAAALDGVLDLLHLTAGVSYFKAADPPAVDTGSLRVTPALAKLATLLYREGLAEFRFENGRNVGHAPAFAVTADPVASSALAATRAGAPSLVPVGGGKDSAVTIEALKAAGHELELFSVGDAEPIARTAAVAGRPRLVATRRISPTLFELNERGALNGHVPVTAIVTSVALLTALLGGHGAVVMSNERSAGRGSFVRDGIDVNHQFSKGLVAEQALATAVRELVGGVDVFSLLRPASELAIARAFARLTGYHAAFTSCNAVFRIDPARRAGNWCGECPKCRFVWLVLAPFLAPAALEAIFGGRNLYRDEAQYAGFAALAGLQDEKPFECVGTEDESAAAVQLAAADPRWAGHPVLDRLAVQLDTAGVRPDVAALYALSDDHLVPARFMPALRAALEAA
jgi:hypothetical protein